MRMNEVERTKRERPEGIIFSTGACCFCGQIRQIEALKEWTPDAYNEMATEMCECIEAINYTAKKRQKERAEKIINRQFGEGSEEPVQPEVIDFLKTGAEMIIEQKLGKLTVTCAEGIEAKISITAKGLVKIKRKKTEEKAEEA